MRNCLTDSFHHNFYNKKDKKFPRHAISRKISIFDRKRKFILIQQFFL